MSPDPPKASKAVLASWPSCMLFDFLMTIKENCSNLPPSYLADKARKLTDSSTIDPIYVISTLLPQS